MKLHHTFIYAALPLALACSSGEPGAAVTPNASPSDSSDSSNSSESSTSLNSPQASIEGTEGHGGDAIVLDFVQAGRRLANWLKRHGSELTPAVEAPHLLQILETAKIHSTDEVLLVDRLEKDAKNFPERSEILINRARWASISSDHQKVRIVAHELFSLMGIPDSKYELSSQISQRITSSDSPIGASALEMLDLPFEFERELLLVNEQTSRTFKDWFFKINPLQEEARRRGGQVRSAHGVVYAGFFNNFNYSVSEEGLLMWPKLGSILRPNQRAGAIVLAIPFRLNRILFELHYGGINSISPTRLTYVTPYYFTGGTDPYREYPYYYYLSSWIPGFKIEWEPSGYFAHHIPKADSSWDFSAKGEDAMIVIKDLSLLQRINTGFELELEFNSQ